MLRRINLGMVLLVISFAVMADGYWTKTGFRYPIGTDAVSAYECGRWLGKPTGHGGCYFADLYHTGVDMKANEDARVHAVSDGKVIGMLGTTSSSGWGNGNTALLVEHYSKEYGMFRAVYGHVKIVGSMPVGSTFVGGAALGKVGHWDSGDHLHFGILKPGLLTTDNKSSYGRWSYSLYGVKSASGRYDNGFIDPIYFITHTGPDNAMSRAEMPAVPASITPQSPWFASLCVGTSPDSRCDESSRLTYNQCVSSDDASCTAVPASAWSAVSPGGMSSGGTRNIGFPMNLEATLAVKKADGSTLYVGTDTLTNGQSIDVSADVVARGDDARGWMKVGETVVSVDFWVRIGTEQPILISHEQTKATNLLKDVPHKESVPYVVPDTAGQRISFWVTIDEKNVASESNEADNTTPVQTFDVVDPLALPDFKITKISLKEGITVKKGSLVHPMMTVKNTGPGVPSGSIRSSYSYRYSTTGPWIYIADDGSSDALCVGCVEEESIGSGFAFPSEGTVYLKGCADYPQSQSEVNEKNNCKTSAAITVTP